MISPYCTNCSSPRLQQSLTRILPLKTPLPVPYWILTLIVTHFPAPVNQNFIVLPRWALWDRPKRKQIILQTPICNPHTTRRKFFQLRCRPSHQEIANWKNCLPMRYQLTHPSLRGSIPNTFSYMTKFASWNLATQMLSSGRFPR